MSSTADQGASPVSALRAGTGASEAVTEAVGGLDKRARTVSSKDRKSVV